MDAYAYVVHRHSAVPAAIWSWMLPASEFLMVEMNKTLLARNLLRKCMLYERINREDN